MGGAAKTRQDHMFTEPCTRAESRNEHGGGAGLLFLSLLLTGILFVLSSATPPSSHSMPPHRRILSRYLKLLEQRPELAFSRLRQRGIETPSHYPDGTPVYDGGRSPAGTFNALALMVEFSDNQSSVNAEFFDTLIFGAPGNESVRDYYYEISYGSLDIVTVDLPGDTDWQAAPHSYAYYVDGQYGFGDYPQNAQGLVEDVVALADPLVDFSQYDNDDDGYVDALFVIHAGPGAEFTGDADDIWSHAWSTSSPQAVDGVFVYSYSMEPEYWSSPGDMTIGVYAHELGHVLGLPDWYDYGYDSAGIGVWCLMSFGSWNGDLGDSPSHVSAEGRRRLGFVEPVSLAYDVSGLAIPEVESNQESSVFYLWDNGEDNSEYWLIENRQQTGYDAGLPASGLLIWHVDAAVSGNDDQCTNHDNCYCGPHYEVALEQADGEMDLEYYSSFGDPGDPYPGTSGNTVFDLESTPNSGSYADCSSCVSVSGISSSAPVMYADVNVLCSQPVPDIDANGSDGPVMISSQEALVIDVSLEAGGLTVESDWWLAGRSPFGWYHYLPGSGWVPGTGLTYQGPLMDITGAQVLDRPSMPPGSYTFFFGVDLLANGRLDTGQTYADSVRVNVE